MKKEKTLRQGGYSLLEVLVVVVLFSVVSVIITRSLSLTLKGTRKSESLSVVRANLNYALTLVSRRLKNALEVSPCPNPDPASLTYLDEFGTQSTFSCVDIGDSGFVASDSAEITSSEIDITSCSFVCSLGQGRASATVSVTLSAETKGGPGADAATSTSTTTIYLRSY